MLTTAAADGVAFGAALGVPAAAVDGAAEGEPVGAAEAGAVGVGSGPAVAGMVGDAATLTGAAAVPAFGSHPTVPTAASATSGTDTARRGAQERAR
ncbi:hypothetical protein ACFW1A_22180 [Kitasatospora sp. NPDC058965]|uniref:hypothetical protein n=1 Tax=Kitasatospora sp. NPDC058965 TaxID=3346682 RepID=UPI0036AD4C20